MTKAPETEQQLTFAERDVLAALHKVFRPLWSVPPSGHPDLTPGSEFLRDLAAAAGQSHTGNIPGIILSLAVKGYLRGFERVLRLPPPIHVKQQATPEARQISSVYGMGS